FVDLGRASGISLFAAFAALGLKNSPWFLAIGIAGHGFAWDLSRLRELGLYPGLVRSCLHARGLSAGCLCGRACPRVQRGVAHSEGQLRRSRAHDSSVFVWLIGSFICRFLTVCLNAKSGEERVVYKRLNST